MNADHETVQGVHVTRRATLHGTWALPALWMLSRLSSRTDGRAADEIEALLQRWTDSSAELVASEDPNEDAHLMRLCADLADVDPGAFPPRQRVTYDKDGMTSGPVHVGMPFIVIQFDLDPGAVIPAHNHVGWGFVSMGVRGESTVRHFEVAGEAPEPGADLETRFPVREVTSALLLPGRTSSLTRARANIHQFRAGEQGATFLDFGVRMGDPGKGPRSGSSLEVDPEPLDPRKRLYEARWLGDIYK